MKADWFTALAKQPSEKRHFVTKEFAPVLFSIAFVF